MLVPLRPKIHNGISYVVNLKLFVNLALRKPLISNNVYITYICTTFFIQEFHTQIGIQHFYKNQNIFLIRNYACITWIERSKEFIVNKTVFFYYIYINYVCIQKFLPRLQFKHIK